MPLKLGYNTNGFAQHRLADALRILADLGYASVAITLDRDALNPYDPSIRRQIRETRRLLERLRLSCVIETGARHLLDPNRKHEPTLVSADAMGRARRLDFLKRAVDVAADLSAEAVSFWSGRRGDDVPPDAAWTYLVEGCCPLAEHAARRGMNLAFEPEPDMLVATMAQFDRLTRAVDHPCLLLTLDVGHVYCLADGAPADRIRQYAGRLCNVHIEDMRRGVHEHLMLGRGDLAFEPILAALSDIRYPGGVHVELSRHSHDAENAARSAHRFLRRLTRNIAPCRSSI